MIMNLLRKNNNKKMDDVWGITTFFNPVGYRSKKRNYNFFRKKSKKQGLKLVTVELAFDNAKFELKERDADILLQLRTDSKNIMWQKERLMNIAFKKIPESCNKIVWIDCDVFFENDDWVEKVSASLDKYIMVQPFSKFIRLGKGVKNPSKNNTVFDNKKDDVFGQVYSLYNNLPNNFISGLVWAFRREVFEKNLFYDEAILGSGDRLMSYAFYNKDFIKELDKTDKNFINMCLSVKMRQHYQIWLENVSNIVKGNTFYIDQNLYHLWHGDVKDRKYYLRNEIIKKGNFDPNNDIAKDKNGVWKWNSEKIEMQNEVREYFWSRKEDTTFGEIFLIKINKIVKKLLSYFISNENN